VLVDAVVDVVGAVAVAVLEKNDAADFWIDSDSLYDSMRWDGYIRGW